MAAARNHWLVAVVRYWHLITIHASLHRFRAQATWSGSNRNPAGPAWKVACQYIPGGYFRLWTGKFKFMIDNKAFIVKVTVRNLHDKHGENQGG